MPIASSWALQSAIYTALVGSSALTTLLGGAHVYDDVPQDISPPYMTIGQNILRDWSTGTEVGEEHEITLNIWSKSSGRKQVQDIAETVRTLLHDKSLMLTDHNLVNLRQTFLDFRREPDGEHYRAVMRFRAVTEPS
ncbi:MAG: DUF3168 domain-containing protein [Pseudomonadota bacterium]